MIPSGRPFVKMSGSGNDFVIVDCRSEPPGDLASGDRVRAICARGTGVGADGVVFLQPSSVASVKLTYLNADGSLGELCGNATLCVTRLAVELGVAKPRADFTIETDAGVLPARIADGIPEIELEPVAEVRPAAPGIELTAGERRIGFALAGVPHLVVEVEDLDQVDVLSRGRLLRRHPSLARGANVNFVRREPPNAGAVGRWAIRTYERGVEAETLACGTGAVASAIMLTEWGEADHRVELLTRSGRSLRVRLRRSDSGWIPTLGGDARVVFQGVLSEV
jgi:diaminopimelate epimerase